jgi:hypothetical protein
LKNCPLTPTFSGSPRRDVFFDGVFVHFDIDVLAGSEVGSKSSRPRWF